MLSQYALLAECMRNRIGYEEREINLNLFQSPSKRLIKGVASEGRQLIQHLMKVNHRFHRYKKTFNFKRTLFIDKLVQALE